MNVSSSVHIKNGQIFYSTIILSEVTDILVCVFFLQKKTSRAGNGSDL